MSHDMEGVSALVPDLLPAVLSALHCPQKVGTTRPSLCSTAYPSYMQDACGCVCVFVELARAHAHKRHQISAEDAS